MNTRIFSKKYGNYWILLAIFTISVICRLINTLNSNIIPGLGSMYYPLQVRCLLEKASLGFNDVPLVFWMEALLARIIIFFSNAPVDNSIVLACKLINVIVPSLMVLPVFFLSKSISSNQLKWTYLLVLLALSVLNPSILVVFAVDFDKNAIGMLFMLISIYYIWRYMEGKRFKSVVMVLVSVTLTLLTHFGCFSSLFLFLIITAFIVSAYHFRYIIHWFKESRLRSLIVLSMLAMLILLPFVINLFDNQRFEHLTRYLIAPIQLFSDSPFIQMIRGEFKMDPPNLFFFIILNLFSILSIISWLCLRKRIRKEESIFLLAMVLWYVFLSNPFINTEIFRRLLFISLIPFNVILIFVFYYLKPKVKIPIAILMSLLLVLSVATNGVHRTYISKEEYTELKQFKSFIPEPNSSIVLAQHRLEFWTAWTLHMKSGQLRGIKTEEYPKYSNILYLVQKSNKYPEKIPDDAILIHTGHYFDLYRIFPK